MSLGTGNGNELPMPGDPGAVAENTVPATTDAYDLGNNSTPYRWRYGYLSRGLAIVHSVVAGSIRTALTFTGAADTTCTASTEQPDVYLNGARTVQWATGALTNQRMVRIAAPTLAFVGASTVTNAATLYVNAAPTAGANATITNNYAMWVDAGSARFDGPVVQNDYPVINNSGTVASPVTTINTPTGITVVANGATSVAVTCTACTAESVITGAIMNATSNNVSLRAIIPGAGSFVVHVSGDPGASTAIIRVVIAQPGTGV